MKLSDLPIERPVATLMLLVSLLVLGVVAIFRIPLGFMPTFDDPEVRVEVEYPGAQPMEALDEVARPLEEEVSTVTGVKFMSSFCRQGFAQVEADFDWSANMDLKKLEVREAVERARPRLPEGVSAVRVESFVGGMSEGILEGRISATRNLSESYALLNEHVRKPLERVQGVARVELDGVEPQQVRIELDLAALRSHGLDAGEVLRAIDAMNVDVDAGTVRGDVVRYEVRSSGRYREVEEIAEVRIGSDGLRVGDVATVELKEPRLPYGRHLDRRFAIGITVHKEPSANTVATVDRLLERIEEIERDPALQGISLLVWRNEGEEIRNSIAGLRNAGIYGGILAAFVLLFFLRRVRTTAVVAVAIPFSLIATCGAMFVLGAEFNVLTMLGLMFGVGMLVDNAVVVIENIHRKQGEGVPAKEAARIGLREVFLAIVASTATTVIVWSWLLVFPKDEMVVMLGQVALSICLAVTCSLFVSITFIPLATTYFLRGEEVKPGFVLRRIVPAYRRLLGWTLRHRFVGMTLLLLLAASVAAPFSWMEKTDEPKVVERMVVLRYLVYDSASKEVLEGYVDQVEGFLAERQEELGFDSMYSWFSEEWGTMTRLYLARENASEEAIQHLRKTLREDLPVIPGVRFEVGDRDWWRQRQDSEGRHVQIAIRGDDPAYLRIIASRVAERVEVLPGVTDLRGPGVSGQREARILVDPERARAVGVTPRTVAQTVGFAFRGRNLRRFQGPDGEIQVVVSMPEERQPGVAELSSLPIPREDGTTVQLASVAEVAAARTPEWVWRGERQTTLHVGVEFDEEVTTDQAQDRVRAALATLNLPEGYSWDFGEWGWRRDEGLQTMGLGILVSLAFVIILMMALFESFTQPIAIIITLLMAFVGAFWLLWALGYELNIVAFIGLIILIGIVVNNGIVMVDHVNTLRREGMDRIESLLQGCGDRLRPVLMTAVTTLVGLIPLAVAGSTVAGVYIDASAVAVIGGLTTSTLFTLVALPLWYTFVEDVGAILHGVLPRFPRRSGDAEPPPRGVLATEA